MSELTIKLEVTGLDGLVQALTALVGTANTNNAVLPMQQNAVPTQQVPPTSFTVPVPTQPQVNTMPTQNGFVPQNAVPVSTPAPIQQMPGNSMPPAGVPTTAMPQEFTQDQLSVAAAGLVNQGKQARLLELLHSFGANSLVELPKERYGEFATVLRAEGAVI